MTLAPDPSLSSCEILGPLGAGGMGDVYRARDTHVEREVTIKVLPVELADDAERLRRFERETRTLDSPSHPDVAGIHGIGRVGSARPPALELMPGEELAAKLARGSLPVAQALDLLP